MHEKKWWWAIVWVFAPALLFAQDQNFHFKRSEVITTSAPVKIKAAEIVIDFKPNVLSLEMPQPGGKSYRSFLLRQKEKITPKSGIKKKQQTVNFGDATEPILLNGFHGNNFDGGVPPDNHLAISNGRKLISVTNSSIYIFDTKTDSMLKNISLEAFFDTLQLPANKYDPRVVYDPKQDRFIIVCLSGNTDSTSNIVLAFSQTNDPLDEWNLYELPGDPTQGGFWSDFPMIAITDNELIVTVNALVNDTINTSDSWKFLFHESIIWQLKKQNGYDGQPLQMRFWSDIKYNNGFIRNLCPAQGGSTTYGPNIYLLSNRNFDIENDTFFIVEVTGLLDNAQTTLLLDVKKSPVPYGLAPDGKQPLNRILMTNDSRPLAAYIENGDIHFVQNTINPDTVRSAIYHGIINDAAGTRNLSANILGVPHFDFAYPNISYTGKYAGDDEAIITFDHTSVDSLPGFSAVFYNSDTGYSQRITLKDGEDWIGVLPGLRQRWGDYSGSQRKYDEPGKVWVSGMYGVRIGSGLNQVRTGVTWISALESPDTTKPPVVVTKKIYRPFPNPVEDIFQLDFEVDQEKFLEMALFDMQGRLVKMLLRDRISQGTNRMTFSTKPLSPGVYFFTIRDGKKVIATQKIVQQ